MDSPKCTGEAIFERELFAAPTSPPHFCANTEPFPLPQRQELSCLQVDSRPLPSSALPGCSGYCLQRTDFPSGSQTPSWTRTPDPPPKRSPSRSFSLLTRTTCSSLYPLPCLHQSGGAESRCRGHSLINHLTPE